MQPEEKKISIIVPVYNVISYLKKCVDSICAQTYSNLEIILIDDGSTDGSELLCDQLAQQDARIKVIHKQNGGQSSARNAGMQIATGEYIQFVDSDDWIDHHMTEDLYNALESTGADMSLCGYIITNGTNEHHPEWFQEDCVLSQKEAMIELIADTRLTSHVVNRLYRCPIIKEVPFPESKIYEDILMMHFVFQRCTKFAIVKNRYYYYNLHPNSTTTTLKLENKLAFVNAIQERYEVLKDSYPDQKKQLQGQIAMTFALSIVQNNYAQSDYAQHKTKVEEGLAFIKRKDIKQSVKGCFSRKDRILYTMALLFKTKSNRVYRLFIRKS